MFRNQIIQLIVILCFLMSCQDKDFSITKDWKTPSTRMIYIDSCTVKLSTSMVDSVATSNKRLALVGKYNDNNLTGITEAASYLEIKRPTSIDVEYDAVFDSLVMHLTPNGQYYGDTLVKQSINVYRLKNTLSFFEDGYLYNNSITEIQPQALTKAEFYIYPSQRGRTREIKLPKELGEELLKKFIDKSPDVESDEKFEEYFKGLALIPDGNISSSAIIGYSLIDTAFKIKLHYHIIRAEKEKKEITFQSNTSKQYNRITANRSNTPLKNLISSNEDLVSDQTNNQAYIQTGVPLYTKIEFPYISYLQQTGRFGKIKQALLYIRPIVTSYEDVTPLPRTLNIYISNNSEMRPLVDNYGNLQTGNLRIDNVYRENTYYSFDITNFLNSQLNVPDIYKSKLELLIPSNEMGNTIKRLVIGDANNDNKYNRIELKIIYASYDGTN